MEGSLLRVCDAPQKACISSRHLEYNSKPCLSLTPYTVLCRCGNQTGLPGYQSSRAAAVRVLEVART